MLWHSFPHSIPLMSPPRILRMSGRRIHGLHGQERYRLERFWCLNLFQGEGELRIANKTVPFRHGYAGITWPGEDLVYTFRERTIKTWVHFIPQDEPANAHIEVPVMQDLGEEFERIRAELQMLSSFYRVQPTRAVARLWDILWALVPEHAPGPAGATLQHPVVSRAMDEIDMHLAEKIEVEALANELDISQTHLNRLFREATGSTVGDYIRSRRMDVALHLLCHTTMPIKQVSWNVGIPDLQYFNKAVRARFGQAPRLLRANKDLSSGFSLKQPILTQAVFPSRQEQSK